MLPGEIEKKGVFLDRNLFTFFKSSMQILIWLSSTACKPPSSLTFELRLPCCAQVSRLVEVPFPPPPPGPCGVVAAAAAAAGGKEDGENKSGIKLVGAETIQNNEK